METSSYSFVRPFRNLFSRSNSYDLLFLPNINHTFTNIKSSSVLTLLRSNNSAKQFNIAFYFFKLKRSRKEVLLQAFSHFLLCFREASIQTHCSQLTQSNKTSVWSFTRSLKPFNFNRKENTHFAVRKLSLNSLLNHGRAQQFN